MLAVLVRLEMASGGEHDETRMLHRLVNGVAYENRYEPVSVNPVLGYSLIH